MRTSRVRAAVAIGATAAAVLVAQPAKATTTGSFTCTQTTSGRSAHVQAVSGRISADGSPDDVLVTRPYNPSWPVDFGPVANPPLVTDVNWRASYGLDAYDVSTVPFPPPLTRRGLFGIPHNPPGITGSTFTALLLTQFTGGGQWSHWFSCTVG
jgi:hypothetical protein